MTAPLAEWLRWIAEMPAAFRAAPEGFAGGSVRAHAVAADLIETLCGARPEPTLLAAFDPHDRSKGERNRMGWLLAACHALWHPSLRGVGVARDGIERFLVQELAALAAVAPVESLDTDEERREELARRVLRSTGLRPAGESGTEFEDRLRQVDSVERHRLLAAAAERERRNRQVREQMARKAAEEAAAKVSRE